MLTNVNLLIPPKRVDLLHAAIEKCGFENAEFRKCSGVDTTVVEM